MTLPCLQFPGIRRATLPLLLLLAACGGDGSSPTPPPPPPPPPPTPTTVTVAAGDQQQAAAGSAVSVAPAVLVRNAQGQPVSGVTVAFSVAEGGGTLEGGSPSTDATGTARVTRWTLGPTGTQRLSAAVGSLAPVSFQATITPGTDEISVSLGTGGGSYEIVIPGHPYQGLRLTVPAGTYPGGSSVQMRVVPNAPLPAMPSGYRVSGPPIEVYTPEMRGAKLMTLDIPITRAASEDVLIAFYDPARRIIEALPTVGRTATSVRVMTGHLRADLLVGRPRPAAAPSAGFPPADLIFPNGPTGYLLQIAMSLPLQPVAPVLNPAVDRWPVVEHGSSYFPDGHGPAIPGLVALGAAQSAGLSQKVVPLPRPGFYADAAPLAAVVDARRNLSGMLSDLAQMNLELAMMASKALRDEMVHHNVVGGMGLSGSSSIVALMPLLPAGPGLPALEPVFANTVSGTETTFAMISPAQAIVNQLVRALTGGYDPLSVLPAADQPPITVDGVIPLPSFVFPVETLNPMFGEMLTVLSAPMGSQQREAGNLQMGTFVGFPTGGMDMLPFLGAAWLSTSSGTPIVIRGPSAALRRGGPFSPPGFIMNSLPGLAEVGSVDPSGGAGFVSTASLADFVAAPDLAPVQYVITPTGTGPGGIKQTGSFTVTLVKAPFKVTPATVNLPADLKVDFVAEVPLPPAGGFRIKWNWGSPFTAPTETVGTLTATHTYAQPGDYAVTVTLQENTVARESLAEIVVLVQGAAEPFWRFTTFVDEDGWLDNEDPQVSIFTDMIARLVANPQSGVVAIEVEPGAKTVVRMRVLPSTTWGSANCCPPPLAPFPGEFRQSLGEQPSISYPIGPFFAGYGVTQWSQSTINLAGGTLTGQFIEGGTEVRQIENQGSQVAPRAVIRISATRNGTSMVGTITVYGWLQDGETGEIQNAVPKSWAFPFTAVRLK